MPSLQPLLDTTCSGSSASVRVPPGARSVTCDYVGAIVAGVIAYNRRLVWTGAAFAAGIKTAKRTLADAERKVGEALATLDA